ncbi:hypothetical protein BJ165DRAFT_1440689 [Panaeolus papilionaceus]|nr:hypothetical protein BJ165DRAFT_1440689 [Panaeolus papilionaceus]
MIWPFLRFWSMGLDEKHFGPDACQFNPEIFLDSEGNIKDLDRILAYGFETITCVEKHIASSMLWLMMASILPRFALS